MSVLSDPYGELPLRNDKYAALCSELHLSNRNITTLAHFNAFSQLSTLWVNNNKLSKLEGLDKNVRLRNLHAHGNRITRLEGSSLTFFKFLEYLTLNDNLLESITDVVNEIKQLRHLKNLDLFGNPISQEDNYRLLVLAEIPWLHTLDRVVITRDELSQAVHLKSRLKKMMVLKASSKFDLDDNTEKSTRHERSENLFDTLLPYIKNTLCSKRVILEDRFLDYDPRKTGMVKECDFQAVLKQYGILDIVSEEELSELAARYTTQSTLPGISPAPHTCTRREMINYRKFCDDFLTPGLRVHHPGLQKLDTWKMHVVPEVSVTATDLRLYVQATQRAQEVAATRTKREALFSGSADCMSTNFSFKGAVNEDDLNQKAGESWAQYMLRQFVLHEANKIEASSGKKFQSIAAALAANIMFSKRDVGCIFEHMSKHGKLPTISVDECVQNLFQKTVAVSLGAVWGWLGPPDASSSGSGSSPGKVQWRDMTQAELDSKEGLVFEEAGGLLDSLLRSGAGADPESEKKHAHLLAATLSAATAGTRLAASKTVRAKAKSTTTPQEVIQAAPNRCDAIVIPALMSAAIRTAQDEELKKTHDWESEFVALGLRGEALQIALTRKKRSLLADEKEARERDEKEKDASSTSRFPAATKNESRGRGWGSATGTVILR